MTAPFSLFENEEIIEEARPHPLSMSGLFLFWLFLAGLGVFFLLNHQEVTAWFADALKWKPLRPIAKRGYDLAWMLSILLPLLAMALFRINFGYVSVLGLLLLLRFLLAWKGGDWFAPLFRLTPCPENLLLIGAGAAGVLGVELFRRGHRYYLTDRRLVARFGTLRVSERSVLYSKIDDLVLQQGLLGRLFDFGTVIPVTSSGLGMGQDFAIAGGGVGGGKGLAAGLFAAGGKVKNVPRDLSFYVLYGVKQPQELRDLIMELMAEREPQPDR